MKTKIIVGALIAGLSTAVFADDMPSQPMNNQMGQTPAAAPTQQQAMPATGNPQMMPSQPSQGTTVDAAPAGGADDTAMPSAPAPTSN